MEPEGPADLGDENDSVSHTPSFRGLAENEDEDEGDENLQSGGDTLGDALDKPATERSCDEPQG